MKETEFIEIIKEIDYEIKKYRGDIETINKHIISLEDKYTKKYMPMQYLNKLLSEYHIKNISTVDDAKKLSLDSSNVVVNDKKSAQKRDYEKQELDSLFDSITEIEI